MAAPKCPKFLAAGAYGLTMPQFIISSLGPRIVGIHSQNGCSHKLIGRLLSGSRNHSSRVPSHSSVLHKFLKLNVVHPKAQVHTGGQPEDFLFRQLFDYKSYTFTYLLADKESKQAILIDPVIDTVDRDIRLVKDFGLDLVYGVNTHVHADHITGTGKLKAQIPSCKSVIAESSEAQADVKIKEGDKVKFGKFELEVRSTPGHTNGCLSYVFHEKGMVFTGDALLIRGCGRTDFQQGDAGRLYDSVHNKIYSLPHHFSIYPAHDYTGQSVSTVGEEIHFNPRLSKPKSEFIEIMGKLQLPYPKQIDKAVPANMVCGIF